MQPGRLLTDFLDALPEALRGYSPTDRGAATSLAKLARSNGIVFAVEGYSKPEVDIEEMFGSTPLTPPYPVTILEYMIPPVKSEHPFVSRAPRPRILVAKDSPEGVIIIPMEHYAEMGTGWVPPSSMFLLTGKGPNPVSIAPLLPDTFEGARKLAEDGGHDIVDVVANVMVADLATYAEFCRVLHEHEVTFDDVEPDKAKNRMRRARGKVPLFTYKVLTVGKKKRKSRHLGGTHASPRSHLRRGYYRTSRNGLRHWVQPCMVKGDTDGFVHKDYKVEGQTQ